MHLVVSARAMIWLVTGNIIPASRARIAITRSSSRRVKPWLAVRLERFMGLRWAASAFRLRFEIEIATRVLELLLGRFPRILPRLDLLEALKVVRVVHIFAEPGQALLAREI